MATYVNDLRLKEIATGDESGTWGTSTNTNLELIGEALGYATQQVFSSDADATTTVADGASDPARAMYFKITSAGNLTATRTCTIAPNTVSRVMFIENATSGSQSIAISQGSGANVTIATGKTAIVYLDGAGSGAAVVDAMAGVDPGVTDTLAEVLTAGNTTTTDQKVQFRDSAIYINSSADGQLDLVADTEIQIAATTVDINGAVDMSTTLILGGTITQNGGDYLYSGGGNFDIKHTGAGQNIVFSTTPSGGSTAETLRITSDGKLSKLTGDLTIDVAGELILDVDTQGAGNGVVLKDDGTIYGSFFRSSSNFHIKAEASDQDMIFMGNDGGSEITALTLDMSAAGNAIFNNVLMTGISTPVGIAGDPADANSAELGPGYLNLARDDTAAAAQILFSKNGTSVSSIQTSTNGLILQVTDGQGSVVVNDAGNANTDFRVESTSNTHMVFVDASTNKVGINASAPEATLDVKTDLAITEVASANATSQLNFYSRFSDSQRGFVVLKCESLASGSSDLVINARNSFTDAERLRIASTGDVTFTGNVTGVNDLTIADQIMHTGDTSNYMQFHQADGWRVVNSTGERFHIQGASVVFNHDGHDADFRVESSGNANMLFVDASANKVGIGTSSPDHALDVDFAAAGATVDCRVSNPDNSNASSGSRILSMVGGSSSGDPRLVVGVTGVQEYSLGIDNSDGDTLKLNNGSSPSSGVNFMSVVGNSATVFNDAGAAIDFRVESDNQSEMLLVDASADAVIMGNQRFANTPTSTNNEFIHFSSPQQEVSANSSTTINLFVRSASGTVVPCCGTVYVSCENSGVNVSWSYIIDFFYSNSTFTTTARATGNSQGTTTCTVQENGAGVSCTVAYTSGLGGNIRFHAGGHASVGNY